MAGHPQEPSWQPNGQEQARAAAWPQPHQQPTYVMPAGTPQESYGYVPDDADPTQGYPPPIWSPQQAYQQPAAATAAAAAPATHQARSSGEKGFIGSLFDFRFNTLVTPKIIKVLYVLASLWTLLWAVIFLDYGAHHGTTSLVLFLLIVDPIFILLSLGVSRVILEAFIVIFRIYEETRKVREQGAPRG